MGHVAAGQKASGGRAGTWTRVQILQCHIPVVRMESEGLQLTCRALCHLAPRTLGPSKFFQRPRLPPTQHHALDVPSAWVALLSPLPKSSRD